jgi:hypothetical protein
LSLSSIGSERGIERVLVFVFWLSSLAVAALLGALIGRRFERRKRSRWDAHIRREIHKLSDFVKVR